MNELPESTQGSTASPIESSIPVGAGAASRTIRSGLRRTIATAILATGLLAVGGVAVVSAASPTPAASSAPAGSGGPTTPGAGGTHTGANCPGM
ncbi:MAG TPA: hypothetical protein VF323_00860 [Candidatus Limnocylindrales bacterium]